MMRRLLHSIYSFRERYKKRECLLIPHLSAVIMWEGDDWTPAEQREWDRDLTELEREQREHQAKTEYGKRDLPKHLEETPSKGGTKNKQKEQSEEKKSKTWMDWALDDPLYKATFTQLGDFNAYTVHLIEQRPTHLDVARNLIFEVVNPLYQGLNALLEKRKEDSTIKIQVSSREHVGVSYTCYCTTDTWSYTTMDDILEGLNDQLTMKQNLNRGLLLQLSFIKKS